MAHSPDRGKTVRKRSDPVSCGLGRPLRASVATSKSRVVHRDSSSRKRTLQQSPVDRTPRSLIRLISGDANEATALHLNRRHHSSDHSTAMRKRSDLVSFGRERPTLSTLLESVSPPKRNASAGQLHNGQVVRRLSRGPTRGWASQPCWSTVAAPPVWRWHSD